MDLKALKAELNELLGALDEQRAKHIADKTEPTQDELTASGEKVKRCDFLMALIENEESMQRTLEKGKGGKRVIDDDDDDDDKGKRTIDPVKEFRSLGEQLQAVRQAGTSGDVDPRLLQVRSASGLSEGTMSDGGFLVQKDFSTELIQNVWDNGEVPSRIRTIPISSNANGLTINGIDETSRVDGSRAGGILAYWKAEADTKTKSKPKFRQMEFKLHKLIGLCYATDELVDDSVALGSYIQQGFKEEMDFKLTDAIVAGTGAGQPLGIMNAGCMVSVAKESGQTATTIVTENLTKMWARLKATSWKNSVWLINQDCIPQLIALNQAVGTAGGQLVYMPPGGLSVAPYGTLFGRPVIPIEQCETLGTVGDIILADLSQYIAIIKGGLDMASSVHVRFLNDEEVFRFVYRIDGQPVLGSAITPYKGSNTVSHFINLATRA